MKQRSNRMSKKEFIISIVQWSIIAMIWYRTILFRTIHGLSYSACKLILWGLVLSLVTIGTMISWKYWRNHISVATVASLPFSLYTVISYWKSITALFWAVVAFAIILCVGYAALLWSRPYQKQHAEVARKRLQKTLVATRTIISICLAIPVIVLGLSIAFESGFFSAKTEPAYSGDKNKLANNIAMVAKLDNVTWVTLSTNEKIEVLQTVANIEAHYLGLPHELNVRLGPLQEDDLANYDDRTHIITVNIGHIEYDPSEDILNSLCHECYHAHQRRACDAYETIPDEYKQLLEFYDIQVYREEFLNYVGDNSEVYYDQLVERHARAYGDASVKDYFKQINEYLGKE